MKSTTELIRPGDLSQSLSARLTLAGENVTDDLLAQQFAATEKSRADYQVNALLLGMLLVAKKPHVAHGKWVPYVEGLLQKSSTLDFCAESYKSAHVYMKLARRFLSNLERGEFEKELHYQQLDAVTVAHLQSLPTLAGDDREALVAQLTAFVGGRSIRRMLRDMNQAAKDADAEDGPEAEQKADSEKDEEQSIRAAQMQLWEDWTNELDTLGKLLKDERSAKFVSRERWAKIADNLEASARLARQRAAMMTDADTDVHVMPEVDAYADLSELM